MISYKTITAMDAQDFNEKLNNCAEAGFELDKFLIHPMSGWYIGVLCYVENKTNTCGDCVYFSKQGSFYGTCAKDVNTTKNQEQWLSNIEFLCNRYEPKDMK